jgi:sterol desaturase/sphingolipid hydroxylase (fatty acid hydroxylase superfamily)
MLNEIIIFVAWTVIGHLVAALVLYLNHRFVFHGRLGRLPLLRSTRKLHTQHHQHTFDDRVNEFLMTPTWGKLSLGTLFFTSAFIITAGFAFGLLTFARVYGYRHLITHNGDRSEFALHHMHHHHRPHVNFAGVYPIFDRIFGTHEDYKV